MKFNKRLFPALALALASVLSASAAKYEYTTVEGDQMNSLLYTLPNGLKIFMSVNKEQPRVQANIAVRVGGKNDPAETTGLAHYFEHLMFKGTPNFGTTDYAKEKPMLDQIEQLFEVYRQTTDSLTRAQLYHQIDSISYEASKLAIPNEYDKLMSAIGANGTNAYTSNDVTCYVEEIPSNQLDNWAKIQADRFKSPVIRGFHTELETIYEEKNMNLTKDGRKIAEEMLATLYPTHPYGTQTVLGTQTHLKNPSITNIKNYHKKWYVPNNMAVCIAGDIDPDNVVDVITKYFGDMQPNNDLVRTPLPNEAPITAPIERTVLGNEAEYLYLAWRIPEQAHEDMDVINVINSVLSNGKTGLIDLNIQLPQRLLAAGAGQYGLSDGGAFILIGYPNPGQTLDDVRTILLEEMTNLRNGNFDAEIIPATINNIKLGEQKLLENNSARASQFVNAFVNGEDWADHVKAIERMSKITKDDVVRVANKYFTDQNYAALYKRQGKDPNELKMSKPAITPIVMNRDAVSPFVLEVQNTKVEPIEPVFIDFDKDMKILKADKDIPVYYSHNKLNDIFTLTYLYDTGVNANPLWGYVTDFPDLLGTSDMTPAEIQNEFYKLACNFNISASGRKVRVNITGLSENMPKAIQLAEKILSDIQPDARTMMMANAQLAKAREMSKARQESNISALAGYLTYEPDKNPDLISTISNDSLAKIAPEVFTDLIKTLPTLKHRIVYYGPMQADDAVKAINDNHKTADKLVTPPAPVFYPERITDESIVYILPYEAKQLVMRQYSNDGKTYDPAIEPLRSLYNEYFGGSMNAIVFQEMREARSLAYTASAGMTSPSLKEDAYNYITYIGTQNDKLGDAIAAFEEIINNMPESEGAFELAKQGLDGNLRTQRVSSASVPWTYINRQEMGITNDPRKALFEALPNLTLADIVKFQQENVKGRTYVTGIVGKLEDLDMDALKKLGRVVVLTPEQVFGY